MPSQRRRLLVLALSLCFIIPAAAWLLLAFSPWKSSAVTQANCDRIMPGMNQEEVEEILGGLPSGLLGNGIYRWGELDTGEIRVRLDDDRRVKGRASCYRTPFIGRLLRALP
jgi:hypothetical protein